MTALVVTAAVAFLAGLYTGALLLDRSVTRILRATKVK